MEYTLAVMKGDGIGPEVVDQALYVLDTIAEKFNHTFTYNEVLIGGSAIDACGKALPQETIDACLAADSVILGAVGGPKWDAQPSNNRPESALLGIRKALGLFANLRPATLHAPLADACPLKPEIVANGLDLVVVRELTGDVYFGEKYRSNDGSGHDDMNYSIAEVERIARRAFSMARQRNKHVTSVDKANVLETSRVWREVVERIAAEYPDVTTDYMYVDNAAMQLVTHPSQFDVILTGNLFGDILSDEASCITGSIGMLPSASLGETARGMYEPIHGSAPDIAGKNIANPIATILSVAMMLRYSFNLANEASAIESAVSHVLEQGKRTGDIARAGEEVLGCKEMGEAIVQAIKNA
ncbi:MAG: 3-isopropylmalate dehydrogenase [Eggerthellaceae bacterium]|nr:3-isopropylmalate dehydrogenase [Eggerthellaceae bacterium]